MLGSVLGLELGRALGARLGVALGSNVGDSVVDRAQVGAIVSSSWSQIDTRHDKPFGLLRSVMIEQKSEMS